MLKKSIKVQQRLVQEAISLIREKGSATLLDIATRSECNIAAVNYHFKDKATFNRVIVKTVFDEVIDWTRATEKVKTFNNVEDILKFIVEYAMRFVEQNIGVFRYILSLGDERTAEGSIIDAMIDGFDKLMDIVLKHLAVIMPQFTYEQLETKYSILFSGYMMPLIFNMAGSKKDRYYNNRAGYIDEMVRGMMS